ncbi:MAG: hypothetical protein SFU83_19500 [Meiothermus sp.]|nr:hypothetical protein [Meiothermus sp.]
MKFLDHGRHRAVFAYEGFAIKVPTCEDGIKANKFEWDTYHTASPCGRRYLAKPYALCGRVMVVQMYEFEMYTEAEVAAWYARLVDIFGDSVLYDITPHNLVALKNNHPKLLDYS